MGFGVQTEWRRETLPKPEILSYPLETTVIDSGVINATGVVADASGPYTGRRYLVAGTILSKRGDGQYERFTAAAGQAVAGVLYDTVEFADGSDKSDKPVAFLRRNVSFDKAKIVDYVTHETALKAALATCEFI
jgi:hypothetical protein